MVRSNGRGREEDDVSDEEYENPYSSSEDESADETPTNASPNPNSNGISTISPNNRGDVMSVTSRQSESGQNNRGSLKRGRKDEDDEDDNDYKELDENVSNPMYDPKCYGCRHEFGVCTQPGKYPDAEDLNNYYFSQRKSVRFDQLIRLISRRHEEKIYKKAMKAKDYANARRWLPSEIAAHLKYHILDVYIQAMLKLEEITKEEKSLKKRKKQHLSRATSYTDPDVLELAGELGESDKSRTIADKQFDKQFVELKNLSLRYLKFVHEMETKKT